ncbi:MAG: hypothetical protein K2G89_01945 [Lachnospiraceae bacterium]|nr:hypothetical protein [Lachnospiraceae bacterium]
MKKAHKLLFILGIICFTALTGNVRAEARLKDSAGMAFTVNMPEAAEVLAQDVPGQQTEEGSEQEQQTEEASEQGGSKEQKPSLQAEYEGKYIALTWTKAEQGASYEIARSDSKNGKYQTLNIQKKCTYNDREVLEGHIYYYKVRMISGEEPGIWSETVKAACPLKPVDSVKIIRYSTTALKLKWQAQPGAKYYKIYRRKKTEKKYKLIATTKSLSYISRKLSKDTKYYYKVQACVSKKASEADSVCSKAVAKTTKEYQRVTVFAGDSVMTGISICGSVKNIDIGGVKKVVAYKGLGTLTFQTKGVFGGKTGVEKLISYKPYRIYIMLGMNEIEWQKPDSMIKHYREIIEQLQEESPDTDIVLLAVSPVSKSVLSRRKGFRRIPEYNKKLKKLAKEYGLEFFDYTADYKTPEGTLNDYNGGDGIHWSAKGYNHFADILEKLDKRLDK